MENAKIMQNRHFGVIMLIPGLGGRVYAHFLAMEWFWLYSALKMGVASGTEKLIFISSYFPEYFHEPFYSVTDVGR